MRVPFSLLGFARRSERWIEFRILVESWRMSYAQSWVSFEKSVNEMQEFVLRRYQKIEVCARFIKSEV